MYKKWNISYNTTWPSYSIGHGEYGFNSIASDWSSVARFLGCELVSQNDFW